MNLTESTSPAAAAYPVRALADHLRVGTGFSDDGAQDGLLEICARAAMSAIEARTGKVLLERSFLWELGRWAAPPRQGLPVAPVSAVSAVTLVASDGSETEVSADLYTLRPDSLRPEIVASALPPVPHLGTVLIAFVAGYGPVWEDSPADMRQAVLMLAAHFYEHRGTDGPAAATLPFGVLALIDRFRPLRLAGDGL